MIVKIIFIAKYAIIIARKKVVANVIAVINEENNFKIN